jgi:hypothetical protein
MSYFLSKILKSGISKVKIAVLAIQNCLSNGLALQCAQLNITFKSSTMLYADMVDYSANKTLL